MHASDLPFKGVVFDLDGVITSSAELHKRAWGELFTQHVPGVSEFTDADYRQYVDGKPRIEGIRSFLAHKGLSMPEAEEERLAEVKQARFLELVQTSGVKILPGAQELIKTLQQNGIKLAVASSSKNAPLLLDKTGLRDAFEVIVANDQVYLRGHDEPVELKNLHGKPAPDIFLAAAQYLDLTAGQVVGVEDAVAGIQAIKAAGMVSVAISSPEKTDEYELIAATKPDVIVASLADLDLTELAAHFGGQNQ